MNLVKFNRHKPVGLHSFFDDFFNTSLADFVGSDFTFSNPSVNIIEEDDAFIIELAAPGLSKDDFDIRVDKNQLTIRSENKSSNEETDKTSNYRRREFSYSSFTRSFTIPITVDTEKINGEYENGILRLSLQKKEEAKEKASRTIELK